MSNFFMLEILKVKITLGTLWQISRLKEKSSKNGYFEEKIKNFHKNKSDFLKSCLLGHVGFMIRCILNNLIFSTAICKKGHIFLKKILAFLNLLHNTVQHIQK